jgi:hypothetical protein
VARSVKAVAFTSMAASLAYVGLVIRPHWALVGGMAAVILVGVVYLARIPSRPGEPSARQ